MLRVFIDTSVWVSYFGDRDNKINLVRIKLAQEIIKHCVDNSYDLLYDPYVLSELRNYSCANRVYNIEKMKEIAKPLPYYIGNDTWGKSDAIWGNTGSRCGDTDELKKANKLDLELPDRKHKLNRNDRKIMLTCLMENADILLHENPHDFNKISQNAILKIDLLNIKTLNEFIRIVDSLKK